MTGYKMTLHVVLTNVSSNQFIALYINTILRVNVCTSVIYDHIKYTAVLETNP